MKPSIIRCILAFSCIISVQSFSAPKILLYSESFSRGDTPGSTSSSLHETRRGTELSRYKTRSAILQHTLQTRQKEYQLQDNKLQILQDVIQKLQSSNRNLLQKIQELQKERDGIHLQPQSDEIWPPEMGVNVIKEEFRSKEIEWENTLNMAQVKYQKLRAKYLSLVKDAQDRDADIQFYQERAEVDESEMVLLRNDIMEREELMSTLNKEKEDLLDVIEKQNEPTNRTDELLVQSRGNETEIKVNGDIQEDSTVDNDNGEKNDTENNNRLLTLQKKVDDLTKQNAIAEDEIREIGIQWEARVENMQKLVEKEQDKIISLQDQLTTVEIERSVQDENYRQLLQEHQSLKNSTILESAQKDIENKESLEIATAAVEQAKGKEKELKEKLGSVEKELLLSAKEKNNIESKILALEKVRDNEAKSQALILKLQEQIREIENSERLKWERKLEDQENDHKQRIEELELQIKSMTEINREASDQIDESLQLVEVPIPRQKRLKRLASRIKSVLKN